MQLKGFDQWLVTGVADPEYLGYRSGDECRLAERCQIGKVHTVSERVSQTCRDRKREARLACSSRSGEGQQAHVGRKQPLTCCINLLLPTD
jgi:hypothetical protein